MLVNKQKNPALRSYFTKINNEIILNPNESTEFNITMNFKECEYCQREVNNCGENGTGMYCKGFEIVENYVYRK